MAVVKISEIKVSSTKSFDDAIKEGIARAHKTLRNVKSAWVKDLEVKVDDNGDISEFRVLMRVTFILGGLILYFF
jgi:dodecin